MNKGLFKRTAAFVVASLMAGGVITVLLEDCVPKISAEEITSIIENSDADKEETNTDGISLNAETTSGVEINSENFPDENFREYISSHFDKDSNGVLSDKELSCIKSISFWSMSGTSCIVHSLKGIEYFTELEYLDCRRNQLTSLDLSNNTSLNFLVCSDNQLTSLNLNNITTLELLDCLDNKLTSLDVSKNTDLTYLSCFGNQLTSIDVSNNLALKKLSCDRNQLTALDVSKNTLLTELTCYTNNLTSLDVSNNTALEILCCDDNQLTSLDISNNTLLRMLACENNQLTSLDVSNNTSLEFLSCGGNQLTSLDLSNNNSEMGLAYYPNIDTMLGENANSYCIGEICGAYDLKNLPGDFDITKASNWHGATLDGDKLTEIDGTGVITYVYNCWVGHPFLDYTTTFTLTYNHVEHSYDDGVITTEPTEQTEGEKIYTCTNCGETKTEVIAKLEHVHNQGDELMSDATGHWYTCSGCEEKLDFAIHIEDNGTVTVEPTVTAEGQRVYKCTVCGYTIRTEVVAKLENGNTNPNVPSQPSQPSQPQQPQQPEDNEPEINIDAKKGWGNVVKEINNANENSKINVDMGNATEVPKNVMTAIQGKDIDIVLDIGDDITWTINGKDVTDPQSINLSVTKKKNSIPDDMISDSYNAVPLVLTHNGNFGCSAKLSIDLSGNDNKIANLYYYNTKTKELEFVDSSEIINGKANLVFTHASDWVIIISDTYTEYEDVSSAAGVYEAEDNSQAPLYMIVIIIATVGFSSIIIVKRFAKKKH